jgi:hypothetical protein
LQQRERYLKKISNFKNLSGFLIPWWLRYARIVAAVIALWSLFWNPFGALHKLDFDSGNPTEKITKQAK